MYLCHLFTLPMACKQTVTRHTDRVLLCDCRMLPEKIKTVFLRSHKNWDLFPFSFYRDRLCLTSSHCLQTSRQSLSWKLYNCLQTVWQSDLYVLRALTVSRLVDNTSTAGLLNQLNFHSRDPHIPHSFLFCLMFCSAVRPWFRISCSKLYTLGIMSQAS